MQAPVSLFGSATRKAQYLAKYDAALHLWPVPYETKFMATSYGQTHIIDAGQPDASPLLLLHAGQASSTMWYPNVAHLTSRFHVLALDTIGEPGLSTPTRPNATKDDLANWLQGVMDSLELSRAHVMGLSRGAWLALNLAMHAPDRLDRLVLLSPAAAFIKLNSFFSAVAQAVMRMPSRLVARYALNSWVAKGYEVNQIFAGQFITGLQYWNWDVNRKGYSGIMPCLFNDEELGQIRQPTLLLIGDQDRLNPPAALERAERTIPHLQAHIIGHAGHFLNMEQPAQVNELVLNFLSAHGPVL
jgi:pimeloyl-ACP methyl ester carboxylesterase